MRSLAEAAREGGISQLGKRHKLYPELVLQFQHCTRAAGEVVIFIETCGKWPILGGKEGPIHAKSIPSSREKFLDTPVYAAVPADQITPPLL